MVQFQKKLLYNGERPESGKFHLIFFNPSLSVMNNFMVSTLFWLRETLRKKTANFMTSCKKVGRWQTQNMISFLKEIMTRGLVPESLVRKLKPWKIHYLLKNTIPNPQLLHFHLYFCPCHQRFIELCVCF